MGNSTRCHAVIHELKKFGAEISLACSGNGLSYFAQQDPHLKVRKLKEMQYGKIGNRVSIFLTILEIPRFIANIIQNQWKIASFLRKQKIDIIVIDSDYSLFPLAFFLQQKIVAINNSDYVLNRAISFGRFPLSIVPQLFIELIDFVFQYLICDLIISPSLVRREAWGKVLPVPAIIREGLENTHASYPASQPKNSKVLIMLTGSSFYRDLSFLQTLPKDRNFSYYIIGRDGVSDPPFYFLGKVFNNSKLIAEADYLIINAGFSAVSEAALSQKPTIVLPVKNHAEQYFNALVLEHLGSAVVASEDSLREKFFSLIERFPVEAEKKPHQKNEGATLAAKIILGVIS